MKHKIKQIIKRVLAYLLAGCIVSSAAFFSYSNTMTVKAVDNGDLAEDVVYTILATIGVVGATVASGGTLTVPMLMPFLYQIAGDGFDVYNYITDNGDGTVTVSDDLTQLVIQAYQLYKEENADLFDGTMEKTADGYYDFGDVIFSMNIRDNPSLDCNVTFKSVKTNYPCAILVLDNEYIEDLNSKGHYISGAYIVYYSKDIDRLFCYSPTYLKEYSRDDYFLYFEDYVGSDFGAHFGGHPCTKYFERGGNTSSLNQYFYVSSCEIYSSADNGTNITVSSSFIPVYKSNIPALYEGLRTGDFSGAYNYGTMPDCESSKYTGSYSGGDITVKTEKLDGIQEKLDEINQTDKNIDDKLQELLDWLNGEEGGGSSGGFSGWLEKIYAKLEDIEKLVKKLKNWTIADTLIDAADAIADWASFIHDIIADADAGMESVVSTLSDSVGGSVGMLSKKFPFSIPWDIFFMVSLLAEEPQTPVLKIPFQIESIGVADEIVIDFKNFEGLSRISRSLLSMLYCIGLFKVTNTVINLGKDV